MGHAGTLRKVEAQQALEPVAPPKVYKTKSKKKSKKKVIEDE